ncbi:calcium-binding protein [Novosphingobium sp. KCTC 2891]|uniref:beta strand repeat-containing protein n=1 Tax=Novosphingobium sp. KCTC 2891 TaxID=2989730 RepID=UPI0022220434|nr:calcium-binding protein [Novosphingobium sp. KCTC 2891]MCW1382099.1 calcium-binding protein [Novosphingobium sp. KCTC 2891]
MPPFNTITGDDTANLLTGTAADDAIYGLGGADTLAGLAGDDWLDGGSGADAMSGGLGDDTYVVDVTGDTTIELAGEGTDTVRASLSWVLAANVENLVLTGSQAINGTGNALDNVLTGNGAVNILNGGAGNDWLDGGAGDDTLIGGAGNDVYVVDSVGDKLVEASTEGRDTVRASLSWVLADNFENLVLTGTSAIDGIGNNLGNAITGNDADNVLTGLDGNDTLDGGAGADVMIGNTGDDTFIVDNLGDQVIESADEGSDTVRTGLSYLLGANVENLTLTGTDAVDGTGNALANVLTGNTAANHLVGLGGADTLDGKGGGDTLEGGAGDDLYVVRGLDDVVIEDAGNGIDTVQADFTYVLGANVENLTLTGSAAIDGTGNALANVLAGNSAANVLTGGAGDDTYVVDNIGDRTVEAASEGTDTVQSSISWTLADNVETLVLTGLLAIDGTGNALDNRIAGNSGANVIVGGGSADELDGAGGSDIYVFSTMLEHVGGEIRDTGASGTDEVRIAALTGGTYSVAAGESGIERIVIGTGTGDVADASGAYAINVNAGRSANALTIIGNAGVNKLNGTDFADVIDGGLGADVMSGGRGDDTFHVDNSADRVSERSNGGIDTVIATASFKLGGNIEVLVLEGGDAIDGTGNTIDNRIDGNEAANVIDGGKGNDIVHGHGGDDTLIGNAGNDILDGGAGTDVLVGGLGSDTLTGGQGADTFRFNAVAKVTSGSDIVADFSRADGDVIELARAQYKGLGALTGALTADQFWSGAGTDLAHDATDRIIYNTDTGSLWYDADGTGTRYGALLIAQIGTSTHPALDSTDIFVV